MERGSYATNELRQMRAITLMRECIIQQVRSATRHRRKSNAIHFGSPLYYQSLLAPVAAEPGTFESRATLPRYLGVNRACVSKVRKRFKDTNAVEFSAGKSHGTINNNRLPVTRPAGVRHEPPGEAAGS